MVACELKSNYEVPVLHVSQLVGLALGLSPDSWALSRDVVGCEGVLAYIGRGTSSEGGASIASTDLV